MPSATTIRKHLLQALEEKILPTVQETQTLRMILAEPPIDLPPEVKATHLPVPPLPEPGISVTKFGQHWPDVHVNNFPYPYLAFVFEGEADLRVGTTQSMAKAAKVKNQWTCCGCHVLHLPAPTLLLFPPGVPYSDGTGIYWERDEPQPERIRILWVHALPTSILCHLGTTEGAHHEVEYPLHIEDENLPAIVGLLQKELKEHALDYQTVAQSHLSSLFFCLRRRLLSNKPVIGNTVWLPEQDETASKARRSHSSNARQIVERADDYIKLHLSEPLMLGQIAAHCGVSPTHLNRVFNTATGLSTKRYVQSQRMRAACTLLEVTDMSIKEISRMVGFLQVSYFCQVFTQAQRLPPGQYREQMKAPKHAP
jgi:AraC-like DNA-binding protein